MMKMAQLILFFFFALGLSAQVPVSVSISKDTISIGDQVTVTYNIKTDASNIESIDFSGLTKIANLAYSSAPAQLDSLMEVSIVDGSAFGINNDNLLVDQNRKQFIKSTGQIKLSIFSLGGGKLPLPKVLFKDGSQMLPLESPMVLVGSPAALASVDSLEIMPIKEIIREQKNWRDYTKFLYLLLGILAFVAAILFLPRLFRKEEALAEEFAEPEVIIPAHVIAMERLEELKSQADSTGEEGKKFQSDLTFAMREYLENRFGFEALEMTTGQIKTEIKQLQELSTEQQATVLDILSIADIVKFAKGQTGPEINSKFLNDAIELVNHTKQFSNTTNEET